MEKSTSTVEDGTDEQLIEDIYQINRIALGEGTVACQVCGTQLTGGSPVSVYAYRPVGESTFEIGHVVCDDGHDLTTHFAVGVRELIVDGRVGLCSDVATGACWPVLLDPSVRVVSTMESRAGQIVPETPTDDIPWVYGDALLDRTAEHDPHETPADESPPTDHAETVTKADNTDNRNPPDASTGPAGNVDAVPADAVDSATGPPTNDSTVDTDETNGESGEC
jgi:hypothetical protein